MPDELVDLIIRDLIPPTQPHGHSVHRIHQEDLLRISQVSRTWRSCSLPYLFREMSVSLCPDPRTDATGMLRGLTRRLEGKKNIYTLWDFLHSGQPLCRHVQQLSLSPALACPEDMREYALQWRDWVSKSTVDPEKLAAILNVLPSLRVLVLCDIVLTSPTPSRSLPINELYLERSLKSAGDVLKTLGLFSVIKHLHVVFPEGNLAPYSLQEGSLPSLETQIESLDVQGDFPWAAFGFVRQSTQSPSSLSLKTLCVGPVDFHPAFSSMQQFFAHVASTLVSLKCELSITSLVVTGFVGQ